MITDHTGEPPSWPADAIACCRRFLDEVEITRAPNHRIGTSYLLKHIIETAALTYIPMDSLLTVAREQGVPMVRCDERSPNFWLAISTRSIHEFKRRHGITIVV
jgi:hypothetical protein